MYLLYCNVFDFIEYPYLINPPTLRFANYEAIEIELNFEENNIEGGNKIMKPKYYQLFYKVNTIKTKKSLIFISTYNIWKHIRHLIIYRSKYQIVVCNWVDRLQKVIIYPHLIVEQALFWYTTFWQTMFINYKLNMRCTYYVLKVSIFTVERMTNNYQYLVKYIKMYISWIFKFVCIVI